MLTSDQVVLTGQPGLNMPKADSLRFDGNSTIHIDQNLQEQPAQPRQSISHNAPAEPGIPALSLPSCTSNGGGGGGGVGGGGGGGGRKDTPARKGGKRCV